VVRFPGSNCDQDAFYLLRDVMGERAEYVWHEETTLTGFDVVVLPGGFSYGDYLRSGAVARFAPIMAAVREHVDRGRYVIGICNGFQILCEAHLLPGALVRNSGCKFICKHVTLKVENSETPYTTAYRPDQLLSIPIAHGEGRYVCDEQTLGELEADHRILFRYTDANGSPTDRSNPNGSTANIAGIASSDFNIMGMMPHPERAGEKILGSADGRGVFESLVRAVVK
jgi:phosphoribosylformylglycinamidine synthase